MKTYSALYGSIKFKYIDKMCNLLYARQNDIWYCQQVVFYKEIHSADAIVLLNNK